MPDSSTSQTPPPEYSAPTYSHDQALIGTLGRYMDIQATDVDETRGALLGTIREPLAENIAAIREYLAGRGYTTLFRTSPRPKRGASGVGPDVGGVGPLPEGSARGPTPSRARHIVQFGILPRAPARKAKPTINIILFVLTIFTTLLIGSLQQNGNPFFLRDLGTDTYVQMNYWHVLWQSLLSHNPLMLGQLLLGVPFSFALLLILGSHELGHYLTARRYGVDATLPYFLPIPHPLMGTMGAFIRIKSPIPNRKALIRLGVAGPLTGFVFAVPMVIIGMLLSRPVLVDAAHGNISLGSSLLFGLLANLFFPHLAPGYDVMLHPLAFAGWLGFFVTALNLIPMGQLDGGHVAYVALGRFRWPFRIAVLVAMAALGFLWPGWFFWGVLILILGLDHPPTQDEITPLEPADKWLMIAAAVVLVLTFIPAPFPKTGF